MNECNFMAKKTNSIIFYFFNLAVCSKLISNPSIYYNYFPTKWQED